MDRTGSAAQGEHADRLARRGKQGTSTSVAMTIAQNLAKIRLVQLLPAALFGRSTA